MGEMATRKQDAQELAQTLAERTTAMQAALAEGDMDRFTDLNEEVSALSSRLRRLQKPQAQDRVVSPGTSNLVLDGLAELGVPVEGRILSSYLAARFGQRVPTSRYASLRRDARRAGEAALNRPTLVSVLDSSFFTPIPGMLARSNWPLHARIAAPRSKRVFLLQATREMLTKLPWLRTAQEDVAKQVERLAVDVARTVPGAVKGPWTGIDVSTAIDAIDAELVVLLEVDLPQREQAAERAAALSPLEQLFGTEGLHVVEAGR